MSLFIEVVTGQPRSSAYLAFSPNSVDMGIWAVSNVPTFGQFFTAVEGVDYLYPVEGLRFSVSFYI